MTSLSGAGLCSHTRTMDTQTDLDTFTTTESLKCVPLGPQGGRGDELPGGGLGGGQPPSGSDAGQPGGSGAGIPGPTVLGGIGGPNRSKGGRFEHLQTTEHIPQFDGSDSIDDVSDDEIANAYKCNLCDVKFSS